MHLVATFAVDCRRDIRATFPIKSSSDQQLKPQLMMTFMGKGCSLSCAVGALIIFKQKAEDSHWICISLLSLRLALSL